LRAFPFPDFPEDTSMKAILKVATATAVGLAAVLGLGIAGAEAQQRQQQQQQRQQPQAQQQQQQQRQQPQAQQQQQRQQPQAQQQQQQQRQPQQQQQQRQNIPRDAGQTPTGKVLKDTATGRQSPERTFDGRRDTPPVQAGQPKPTTPQQRIQEYRDSGKPTGPQTLQTKPVPPPGKR
jgi:hypothetical protein